MVNFVNRKIRSLTLGEKLKKIRKKSGISLAEMSVKTKIKQDYLKKIESNSFEKMPFDVYIKGFLRSYAKHLNLSSEKIIAQFNKEVGVRKNVRRYRKKGTKKFKFEMTGFIITPKMVSILISVIIFLVGFSYFYLEVNHFSRKPNLVIEAPKSLNSIDSSSVEIRGFTDLENKITINNESIFIDSKGKFKETIGLQKGPNEIIIEASNKFNRNTRKIINIIANYELDTLETENEKNNQSENNLSPTKFFVEIESREVESYLTIKIDDNEKQVNILYPGTILKIEVKDQIEISSGKASNTYVRINEGEFFVLDKEKDGLKTVNLNKNGITLE